jgi:HK97 family phage major capsid protein
MATAVNVDERRARVTEITARLNEMNEEYSNARMGDEAKQEWNDLHAEREDHEATIKEIEERTATLTDLAKKQESRESGAGFYTSAAKSERDIYDLVSYRQESKDDEHLSQLYRDGAKRAIESSTFASKSREDAQTHVERLMENAQNEHKTGEIAKLVLTTGSPVYKRAFSKLAQVGFVREGANLTTEERTALAIGATTTGAFAIPYTLDPTVIPSDNFSVNPFRAISRNVTMTGSSIWQGVSSAGITASFDLEAAEVSDDSPTLAQPTATLRMARAFVRFSMEVADDWSGMQADLGRLLSDAKNNLEGSEFTLGSGTAPHPLGILETANTSGIGTAAFVFTASTAAFVVGDVYKLETALGPRWRPNATFVGNRATYNAIRQFDTAGGASLFIQNLRGGLSNQVPTPGGLSTELLGYPTYEDSFMSSTYATTGQLSLLLGDFSQFVIIDGVGMTVEPVPIMFHTSNNLPSGERGLFCRWRTGSTVAAPLAFRVLKVT